ncbi:hypothetical protein [Salinirubrum litoreum]|uniref:Tat (Twin-arginine translocation) pathway signal sequence n=1 Tax=Salinirubrum litoreum TaxID=1126234 RepID=A0ABD5RCP9_9EURY|nr:hypothetical protein [Salinirubrum litoreum]
MSDDNSDRGASGIERLWSMERRRLLQSVGAGVGALTVGSAGSGLASAKTGCANGPYEGSYEAGVVNVGQIRAEQARESGGGPDMAAGSPGATRSAGGATPPKQAAQASMEDEDGPLTIRQEYDGVNSLETRGGVPSDSQVAVGDGKVLHVLNRNVAIYNKSSGKRQRLFPLERLWKPVIPEPPGGFVDGTPFVFDPRARYDRGSDRYVLCATQFQEGLTEDGERITREDLEEAVGPESETEGDDADEEASTAVARPPKGWFVVAVSATSNPNGKWYVYRVPPEDADGPDNEGLVDYPTLGFDRDAVYMTQNFFGDVFDVTMVALDKAAMYAGETVTGYHFDGMLDPDADGLTFTVQPAQQPYSGGSDGTYYMVNSDFPVPFPGPTGTLTLWELENPLDSPTLECFTLDVDPYVYPNAAQQPGNTGSVVDTLGTRVMNADYDDGSLWTAHSTAIPASGGGSVAAIRWYEIDVASRSVVQSGTYGTPERSTFMPTIGADDGTAMIVHNVSGPDTFPRMDVAGRTADHTAGELEDSVVVEEGKSPYTALPNDQFGPVERWGDYNGVSVDPSSGRFWTVSQYSPDIDIPESDPERDPYFTRIAEVSFEDGPGRGN